MTKKTSPAYRASKEETIPINKLHPFSNHPFHIRHDLEFSELVDSISESGIITPIIVRPKIGVGYEVISGHRRWEACKELGIESIPARVEYIDDDEATILMVNSNIQREHVLPSEKAFAYKMRMEALKHQGRATLAQVGPKFSSEKIAAETGDSRNQVKRYIRLTYLIPSILQMVDDGRIAFNPAVEISYMTGEHQTWLKEEMDMCDATPSLVQSRTLKDMSRNGTLTENYLHMQKLVDSIKENGVLTNMTVRPRAEGGYEIISGHRRFHAAQLAGLDKIKVQVRNVDDDQAIIDMVDANIQREHISPMEKARALKMKNEALKRSAGRPKGNWGQLDPNFPKPRTKEILAEGTGESAKQVQRYIRLNELIPELQKKVDFNTLKFNPAVELSYLTPDEQQSFLDYAEAQDCTPSLSQAQKLKAASKEGTLTPDKLEEIMSAQKPSVAPREPVLNINVSKVAQYFPTGCTKQQMENRILKILESYFRQMAHEQAHEEER